MLSLYKPACEELWFKQALLSDPATMSYNNAWGGVISFPREKWQTWYDVWFGEPEDQRFYRYLSDPAIDQFVGETAWHFDSARQIYLCDVIVHAKYRGRGYGAEGLSLLCKAAKEKGIDALYDDIAADNPSVQLFLAHGFSVHHRTDDIVTVERIL